MNEPLARLVNHLRDWVDNPEVRWARRLLADVTVLPAHVTLACERLESLERIAAEFQQLADFAEKASGRAPGLQDGAWLRSIVDLRSELGRRDLSLERTQQALNRAAVHRADAERIEREFRQAQDLLHSVRSSHDPYVQMRAERLARRLPTEVSATMEALQKLIPPDPKPVPPRLPDESLPQRWLALLKEDYKMTMTVAEYERFQEMLNGYRTSQIKRAELLSHLRAGRRDRLRDVSELLGPSGPALRLPEIVGEGWLAVFSASDGASPPPSVVPDSKD